MKTNQPTLLAVAALFCSFTLHAQLHLPLPTVFRADVQKAVSDFPSQFASLRGAVRVANPQTVEYASLLQVAKAEDCSITQYSANSKPVYNLHALMLSTEDFAEAEKQYKWIFAQLKGMPVTYVADHYTLQGVYEAPAEERQFTTSTLAVSHPPEALQKLRIEVAMQFEFPEWKVGITVFEWERDDEEQNTSEE